jgi:hypothetical protein
MGALRAAELNVFGLTGQHASRARSLSHAPITDRKKLLFPEVVLTHGR